MRALLSLSSTIDRLNAVVASIVCWGLLANAILIAINAIVRKLFSIAWPLAFDMQWHFFAAVVLLMAAYTFQRDQHVRIDILANRLGERGLAWLDLFGIAFVLLPICAAMIWVSWPQFVTSLLANESRASRESLSSLPAWIIKGFIPAGFFLLALQGVAESIRCMAALMGIEKRPLQRFQLMERTE
ncbi:MAG: sugar transporter [Stutzerimonas stutzeri]|uniref:TRAP transporter small permease protein n=1 Tax=Bosea eneae TaxID=151454 RepID=A0ABW0J0S0_9HYPH|nr:MAG: sugar transporter [Stutzerimonas stutzeri]